MDLQLSGKTALVSGSTAGIGFEIDRVLAEEGAAVVVNGRDQTRCDEAAARINEAHVRGRAEPIAADLSDADAIERLVVETESRLGPVDVLVNNAGVFEPVPFLEITDDDWRRFFEVNVLSGVRLCRRLMTGMRDRGFGRIVFISSESAINIPVEMIHYGMTKTAQLSIARGLARELAETGVTVNSVLPGPTWTEGVSTFVGKVAEQRGVPVEEMKQGFVKEARPSSLIGRFAEPHEVADAVAFVCSPKAATTTGSAIRVEGGIVNTPW